MMTVQHIDAIISILTLLLAYLVSVSVAGSFRAWVTCQMGDDTPERLGFLTLNPLMHVDIFGLLFLFLFQFGWGRYVPINPNNIHGPWRTLKLCVAYLSDSFAHFSIATTGLFILLASFGIKILHVTLSVLFSGNLTQSVLAQAFPQSSSLTIALAFVAIAVIFLNVILATLSLIISGFGLLAVLFLENYPEYWEYRNYIFILIPMLLIFFFSNVLMTIVLRTIVIIGYFLAYVLNLL